MTAAEGRKIAAGRLKGFMDGDANLDDVSLTPLLPRRAVEPETPAGVEPNPQPARKAPAGKGPEDRVRPSNCHIPVTLVEPLEALCSSRGLSHGEAIIIAIEDAYPHLQDLIHPPETAGGSLFASRRSGRASRSADGPLTPLNYRLREGDYQTIDRLVEQFGASSRGHLITAALTYYLKLP